jgi:hypothetical protein
MISERTLNARSLKVMDAECRARVHSLNTGYTVSILLSANNEN